MTNTNTKTIRRLTAGVLIGGAALIGFSLPTYVPWMPPPTAQAVTVQPAAHGVRLTSTSSTPAPSYKRWTHRGDGWKSYNDWTGENNGCRNDFELSYAGLVKKSKVTKVQRRENELVPPHSKTLRDAGYVHLIEKDQQENGGCN